MSEAASGTVPHEGDTPTGTGKLPPNGISVLVVEDESDIRDAITLLLERHGYSVTAVGDGIAALTRIHEARPDLVLLDVQMPEMDGWETLDRIRDLGDIPVMLLTARGTDNDKVRGLRGGADDYLVKPFSTRELVARVQAVLRRSQRAVPAEPAAPAPTSHLNGRLIVDLLSRRVTLDGSEVALTPIEWRLLSALVARPGAVLTHQELLEAAWHDTNASAPGRVKFSILRLRRKLGDEAESEASLIETVRGMGYRWREVPL
jgi:DNA-binding response OmpR family regulator